jgi:uncharacterized membrane protein YedE/YeeE
VTGFDPVAGLAGGALIGLAAVLLMGALGRIAGVSGILGGALVPGAEPRGWRVAFVAGLPLGAALAWRLGAGGAPHLDAGWPGLIAAGLLVGIGTQVGNGCTSGHGVCGLARGSGRSLVATLTFMAVAAATVFARRHLLGG